MNKHKEIQRIIDASSYLLDQGFTTYQHIYNYVMSQNKKGIAFVHHNSDGNIKQYNFDQYDRICQSIARKLNVLLADQVKSKNSVIGIKLKNSPAWCFIFWGILMSGYRPLLIDAKLAKENTINLLNTTKAIAIVTDDGNTYEGYPTFTKSDINDVSEDLNFQPNWADEVIFCSSGTTGNIKLVIFNGLNMVNQLNAAKEMPKSNLDIIYPQKIRPLRIIGLIPFHHIFGFVAVFLWYSFYTSTLVFTDFVDPVTIVKDIRDLKVTHIYHVPLFYEVVIKNFMNKLDSKNKDKVTTLIRTNLGQERHFGFIINRIQKKVKSQLFGPQIRYLISGGGNLEANTSNTMNGLGYALYNGYGMTEIGVTSVELSTRISHRIKRSIGRPLYNVSYRIDAQGELMVKSPITHVKEIVDGVEKNTELTPDGYFMTGDIATTDNFGRYYLRGRSKEVIITGNGENVYPDEIESFFKKEKAIANLAAFYANNKIVLIAESQADIYDKLVEINRMLPIHKQPNEIIVTKDPLPLSSSMKVKRYKVQENYLKGLYTVNVDKEKKIDILAGYDSTSRSNVVTKLNKIFKEILFRTEDVDGNAHWINDLQSDSMTYITLISEIEKQFSVKIPLERYGKLTSLNEFAKELLELGCK